MPTKITHDYDSHTKDDLLTEAQSRGLAVKASDSKSDIVAALELSDEPKAPAQPPAPLPPLIASNIPHVDAIPIAELTMVEGALPKDADFTDGVWKMGDEPYALCIHDPDGAGNTHTAKNSLHFWQGTEAQFNATFKRS